MTYTGKTCSTLDEYGGALSRRSTSLARTCSGPALQDSHGSRTQVCSCTCNKSWALRLLGGRRLPCPDLADEQPEIAQVPGPLADVVAQVADLVPLYKDVSRFGNVPTEDELVAHLVVPLLKGLGWPAELIGIKWRYVDVALFRTLPRTPENCSIIIEAKRLGAGVEAALEQARGYLNDLGISRDVVVTDGVRYRMYSQANNFEGIAYANLHRLKQPAMDLFTKLGRNGEKQDGPLVQSRNAPQRSPGRAGRSVRMNSPSP